MNFDMHQSFFMQLSLVLLHFFLFPKICSCFFLCKSFWNEA